MPAQKPLTSVPSCVTKSGISTMFKQTAHDEPKKKRRPQHQSLCSPFFYNGFKNLL